MRFLQAEQKDKGAILELYRQAVGSEGCVWTEDYPNEEVLEEDIQRRALYCVKREDGEIIGAVSIDNDPNVDALENWSFRKSDGVKAAEVARVVVKEEYRGKNIGKKMVGSLLDVMKEMGEQYAFLIVAQGHHRAERMYKSLSFHYRGETTLYDVQWFCYEKSLI